MAITVDQVRGWLKLPGTDDADLIEQVTAATNQFVSVLPVAAAADAAGEPWPDDIVQGACSYAAWLYRTRNAPQGTDSAGNIILPPRRPADVDRLLGLSRPRVG